VFCRLAKILQLTIIFTINNNSSALQKHLTSIHFMSVEQKSFAQMPWRRLKHHQNRQNAKWVLNAAAILENILHFSLKKTFKNDIYIYRLLKLIFRVNVILLNVVE
jgi:hypothetical protein